MMECIINTRVFDDEMECCLMLQKLKVSVRFDIKGVKKL